MPIDCLPGRRTLPQKNVDWWILYEEMSDGGNTAAVRPSKLLQNLMKSCPPPHFIAAVELTYSTRGVPAKLLGFQQSFPYINKKEVPSPRVELGTNRLTEYYSRV